MSLIAFWLAIVAFLLAVFAVWKSIFTVEARPSIQQRHGDVFSGGPYDGQTFLLPAGCHTVYDDTQRVKYWRDGNVMRCSQWDQTPPPPEVSQALSILTNLSLADLLDLNRAQNTDMQNFFLHLTQARLIVGYEPK